MTNSLSAKEKNKSFYNQYYTCAYTIMIELYPLNVTIISQENFSYLDRIFYYEK